MNRFIAASTLFMVLGFAAWGEAAGPPSLVEAVHFRGPLAFCGEPVPLNRPWVRERLEKEMLLTLGNRPQMLLWLKRSRLHLIPIGKALAAAGLPTDLQYIAVIESGLRPDVGSTRGAIGFWQFVPATGRRYGLVINQYRDERRNRDLSTRAAIAYFTALRQTMGSWALACAAFDMGEEGLKAEILAQGETDYYRLWLPLETQQYVFRAIAAKMVLTHPKRYGFDLTDADYYPIPDTDTVAFTCPDNTPLVLVARAAGTDFSTLKRLNPEIRGHALAAGEQQIRVPAGDGSGFAARFAARLAAWQKNGGVQVYVVREGDNLSTIADRFHVPLPALFFWNDFPSGTRIHPGDRLIVNPGTVPGDSAPSRTPVPDKDMIDGR